MENKTNEKIQALNKFLEREKDNLITEDEISTYDKNLFETDEGDFLVLTDEEADEKTEEYISESLVFFNVSFLSNFMPEEQQEYTEEILKPIQEKCESGNEAVKSLVNWDKNKDDIIKEAILSDGRGHFLSGYDGNEGEVTINKTEYYIYRIN